MDPSCLPNRKPLKLLVLSQWPLSALDWKNSQTSVIHYFMMSKKLWSEKVFSQADRMVEVGRDLWESFLGKQIHGSTSLFSVTLFFFFPAFCMPAFLVFLQEKIKFLDSKILSSDFFCYFQLLLYYHLHCTSLQRLHWDSYLCIACIYA